MPIALAKLIPVVRGKPAKLKVMIGDESPNPEFREKYVADPVVKRWVDMAMRIEGTNKTFGVHAAGVVIAADPLDELVPLQRNNDGQVITQYFRRRGVHGAAEDGFPGAEKLHDDRQDAGVGEGEQWHPR